MKKRGRTSVIYGFYDDLFQVDYLCSKRNLTAIEACDFQKGIDNIGQLTCLRFNIANAFVEFVGGFLVLIRKTMQVAGHQLAMGENDGQGCTKFVSSDSEEFILQLVRFAHSCFICACNLSLLLPPCLLDS